MKNYKAFIVEGEEREVKIVENLKTNFFDETALIITLPAGQNIYMLWKKMKADEFETDIIEVLRESNEKIRKFLKEIERDNISEVFLFFDYDAHQKNLSKEDKDDVIERMLCSFNNETENGKLYISYPMVEALRDFDGKNQEDRKDWFYKISDYSEYRKFSARRGHNTDIRKYSLEIWNVLIKEFIEKISFLCGIERLISHKEYKGRVTPIFIYKKEKKFKDKVLILSAFPEFLLDYFTEKFWDKCLSTEKNEK